MVAVVIFETKRRGVCPRWWSGSAALSCLAVLAPALVASVAEAQNLTSLRFLAPGLTINGQAPAVFFERDAEQILTAQVFYEVDYGYRGGDVLFVRAEPFGAYPAKLTPDSGSPSCSTATTPANVDLALQNPAWAPSGAATRHAAAPFLLDEDPDEVPPPQPRSFGFSFGTLCQDSAEEPTEQFRVTVWFQPAGVADPDPIKYPVLQYLVRIIDDDGEGGSETFEISPAAFTVRETDEDAPAALALTFGEARDVDYCFPFELVYSRSTAGAADAWVGSRGTASGSFVLPAGSTQVVVRDLLIAGDDEVEQTELLYVDVYHPKRASTCSGRGSVVIVLTVTIEDDDSDTSGISPTEFTVRETDTDAPAALELTFAQAPDADYCFAFELAHGRSTAGASDAWVGTRQASSGSFVLRTGLTEVVVRDLIIAGDDNVEEAEVLYIDVYQRQRASTCSASGSVVAVLTVTIEDDDSDTSGISPTEFTVRETDTDAPAALALTFEQAADADYCFAFELAYARSTAGPADAWVGSDRSASGSFILSAGMTEIVVRDVSIAGDDEVEGDETLYIDVYARQRASTCSASGSVTTVLTLAIVDDDTDAPGLVGDLEVTETDTDFVALLALSLAAAPDEARCYPYRLAYSRSTAGSEDARLVGSDGLSPVDFGTFVAQPGSTTAVSSNLLVVGDDIIEGDETLHLDVYAPGPAGEASCSPSGAPVGGVVVVIVDDDLPVEIASLRIDGAADGLHREGDSGERESVYLIVTFARRLTEPVTLRYGSAADAEARGSGPKQDVEIVSQRSVTVDAGHIAIRVRVATIIGDDRVEAVEHFSVWAAVDEYSAESKMWLRVGIANDDVPGDEILEVVLEGEGVEGGAIVEGDPDPGAGGGDCQREWKCVFLILGFTGERQYKDVVYQVHTVPGSARPGEDYRFRDGVRVRLEEGHLRAFDVRDPLQLQVRRDFFVEGEREDLFLAVHMLAGGELPLFSWYERIEIVDDDRSGGADGALWFGVAEGDDGLASCPLPSGPIPVAEPLDGGVRPVRLDLAMAQRGGEQPPGGPPDGPQPSGCQAGLGKPVTEYRYELRSGAAEVGRDVLDPVGAGGVVRFVSGRASVDFGVVGDGRLEGAEDLTLALVGGAGTVALFTVVVEDAESARETVSSRTAGAVRIGRVLASEVSDVLADRFSCAASSACSALGARPEAQLWPGGRSGPVFSPETLLRRLARSAGSFAMPGMAPAAVPDGAALAPPALAGSGLSDSGLSGFGLPGPAGGSHAPGAGAVPYGLHAPSHLEADRLAVVGRALDGLRYQGDPGRWLGAVNIARGDHRPAAWTFWARSSYAAVDDTSSTARRLSTSMLSMTGGLDREVGRFRVGVLYTHAFAQSETQVHGYAQEFGPDDPVQGSSWRVVAPYVGWIPHRRFRLWMSPGWVTGGGASVVEGLDATMRMVVSGASLSVYSSREVSVDVEADVFEVDVDRTPSVPERRFRMSEDAFSGRAQRARLAGRMGFPLGDPATAASRLTVRLGRRWDVGTDIDWVWGPAGGSSAWAAQWGGAGQVSATDLLLDLRYRRLRSSLSLVLTLGVQLGGEEPQVAGEHLRFSSRRQVGFGGGLQWGAAGSGAGWSASLRPSYGHVSAALPGWWSGAVPRIGGLGGFEVAPMVDAEVGYGFDDGGRLSVSGRRAFGGGRPGAGGLGAVLRYGRGW